MNETDHCNVNKKGNFIQRRDSRSVLCINGSSRADPKPTYDFNKFQAGKKLSTTMVDSEITFYFRWAKMHIPTVLKKTNEKDRWSSKEPLVVNANSLQYRHVLR